MIKIEEKTLIKIALNESENGNKPTVTVDGKWARAAGLKSGDEGDVKVYLKEGKMIMVVEPERPVAQIKETDKDYTKPVSYYNNSGYKGYEVRLRLERDDRYQPVYLSKPYEVYDFLKSLQYEPREILVSVMLDNANKVVGVYEAAKGGLDSAQITPYQIFQPAYLSNSGRIILAHNHPSGSVKPSKHDLDLTDKIKQAADLHSIQLLDHIIIGHNEYTSLKEKGYL